MSTMLSQINLEMLSAHLMEFSFDFFKDSTAFGRQMALDLGYLLGQCDTAHSTEIARISFSFKNILEIGPYSREDKVNYPGLIENGGIWMRNPSMFSFQIAGMILGLFGALLVSKSKSGKGNAFFFGFLYFALMNVSSIACHNLTTKHSNEWELARLADLVFTGASSLSLVFTAFSNTTKMPYLVFPVLFSIFAILGDSFRGFPFTAEIMYIGSMLLACVALVPRLHTYSDYRPGIAVCYFGLLLLIVSIPMDTFLCESRITYSAVHLIFLGSNVVFFGLLIICATLRDITKIKVD